MERIYQDLTQLIGNTPLVQLNNLMHDFELKARLIAKVESFNPGGSVKDRAALAMIEDAEKKDYFRPEHSSLSPPAATLV